VSEYRNPYLDPSWRGWIRGAHHGGAQALQDLALHLYNSRGWPVHMSVVCSTADDHWEAALAMLLDYRERGEANREFMALCEEIVAERLAHEGDSERVGEPEAP
jgi:hypothetical protein